jgi:heterodisulfide reductase subunit D
MANRDYTAGQLFEIDACTKCRMCAQVCPAVAASQDGELSAVWRMNALRAILQGRGGFLRRIFGNKPPSEAELKHFSDTVFKCTLCANCEEVCPVGIGLKDLWLSLRLDMVHSGSYPAKIDMIRKNLAASRNVFAEDNEERAAWVEDMRNAPRDGLVKDHAEVVYFTGCVAAYFPMAQKIAASLAEIMIACEVDFTLMGENEWCCGFPLLGAGLKDQFQEFAEHNMQAVRAKGAKKVVFACPSCYQAWRERNCARLRVSVGPSAGGPRTDEGNAAHRHLSRSLRPRPRRPRLRCPARSNPVHTGRAAGGVAAQSRGLPVLRRRR